LVQSERIVHVHVPLDAAQLDALAEVAALQDDFRFAQGPHAGANGGLAVEVDGQVDDVPAAFEAVGRRVAPSAVQVDPHRRSGLDVLAGSQAGGAVLDDLDGAVPQLAGGGD